MTASKDDLRTRLINALGENVNDADEGEATRYTVVALGPP